MSADVYTAVGREGQGGWSNYTGSASWLYFVMLEDVIGLKLSDGYLVFTPPLPEKYSGIEVEMSIKGVKYSISFLKDGKIGVSINDMFFGDIKKVAVDAQSEKRIVFHY